jgi:hypothetical protein
MGGEFNALGKDEKGTFGKHEGKSLLIDTG